MNHKSFNHAKCTGTAGTLTLLGALALALTGSGVGFRALADQVVAIQEAEWFGEGHAWSFGFTAALSGDTALVGHSLYNCAHVYVRSGTTWSYQARLWDPYTSDGLGDSVALSGDTALMGASFARLSTGSAYVFVRNGGTWSQQAKLTASDGTSGDHFGSSVALSGDTALIGAIHDIVGTVTNTGSAYVFVRNGGTWSQQAKLTASDGAALDHFAGPMALSGDTALVGARGADTAAGLDAGAAYVFVRSGTTWAQQAKLTASDGAAQDGFGGPAALSGDTALVGAGNHSTAAGQHAGAAYVFVRSGSTWTQQAKLTASDGGEGDCFGGSVALSGDRALIGMYSDDTAAGTDAGSVYLFVRSGTTWTQRAKITAGDGGAGDAFGLGVALSDDTALVCAPFYDTYFDDYYGYDVYVGAVYVFRLLTAPDGYNRLTAEPLTGGAVRLTYVGLAGTNYALDRTFNLQPAVGWTPQETNAAPPGGTLLMTNIPVPTTNNFWRMRSVP